MVPTARMQRTRRWLGALVILLALGQAHGFAPTACARHIFIAAPVANNARTDGAHGLMMLARKVKKSGANKKKPAAKAGGKSGGGFGVSSSSGALCDGHEGICIRKHASPYGTLQSTLPIPFRPHPRARRYGYSVQRTGLQASVTVLYLR